MHTYYVGVYGMARQDHIPAIRGERVLASVVSTRRTLV